jgi:hypothetical protein
VYSILLTSQIAVEACSADKAAAPAPGVFVHAVHDKIMEVLQLHVLTKMHSLEALQALAGLTLVIHKN